jgi:hypothetical protein
MLIAHFQHAEQGEVNLPAMRNALERIKGTGTGLPGLDAKYIAQLESMLARFEQP